MDIVPPRDASTAEQQLGEITTLVRRFAGMYFDEDDGEDLAQDAALSALLLMREGRWAIHTSLEAYCFNVVQYAAADDVRRRERRVLHDVQYAWALEDERSSWMAPDARLEESLHDSFYERTVAALPSACRTVFAMVREDNAPYETIARQLGVTRATVASRMLLVRQRFRAGLVAEGIVDRVIAPAPRTADTPFLYEGKSPQPDAAR